jgi:hypothetical protein
MLAGAAALAVSACGAVPASAQRATTADATPADATPAGQSSITQAQAREVFDHYVAVTKAAASVAAPAAAKSVLPLVTGVERDVLAAVLGSHSITQVSTSDSGPFSSSLSITISLSIPAYTYSTYSPPTFFLPEQAGYPKFFAAFTIRSVAGTSPAEGTMTQVGGVPVPLDGPVLMLFAQESAGTAWKLASVSGLPPGVPMPALATDASGHVAPVSLSAPGLLIPPREAGALQAAVVDEGTANPASRVVAAGPLTTGLYQGARGEMGFRVPRGDVYQWTLEGTTLPAFALRTADGGALVWYAMTLNTTIAVPDVIDKADPIRPGPAIAVPLDLQPLLPAGTPATPHEQLQAGETLSFAAVDPPAGRGELQVVAIGGGLTSASAS